MIRLKPPLRALQSRVSTGQIPTREYLESFEPKSLRRLKVFDETPPEDIRKAFFEKLTSHYSNPRAILRLYRSYIAVDDYPCYSWLVRCLCQLGNSFSFNSFWYATAHLPGRRGTGRRSSACRSSATSYSTLSSGSTTSTLVSAHAPAPPRAPHDFCAVRPRVPLVAAPDAPAFAGQKAPPGRRAYSPGLAPLDARGHGRLPRQARPRGRHDRRAQPGLAAAERGRDPRPLRLDAVRLGPAVLRAGAHQSIRVAAALPVYLSRACRGLNLENLPLSGWTQYYLYMALYCADVEKPRNERQIKEAIPYELQESLHTRWLNEILIHAQPQRDVDTVLEGLGNSEGLINCSVGRPDDEQHCLFTGHLFPNRRLCFEYNSMAPAPDGTPVEGGLVAFRRRLFGKLGYNTAVIHRAQWDALTILEKEEQLTQILARFPVVEAALYESRPEAKTFEGPQLLHLKHLRPKVETWPPDKISV